MLWLYSPLLMPHCCFVHKKAALKNVSRYHVIDVT